MQVCRFIWSGKRRLYWESDSWANIWRKEESEWLKSPRAVWPKRPATTKTLWVTLLCLRSIKEASAHGRTGVEKEVRERERGYRNDGGRRCVCRSHKALMTLQALGFSWVWWAAGGLLPGGRIWADAHFNRSALKGESMKFFVFYF